MLDLSLDNPTLKPGTHDCVVLPGTLQQIVGGSARAPLGSLSSSH